jgi:putative heme-binding domain-containing protein
LTSGTLRHAKTEQDIIDIISNGIPGTGMPGFGAGFDEYYRPVAAYILSHEARESDRPSGDPVRGGLLFNKHNCGSCHWTGSSGGRLGTNLARLTATPEYVRQSMRYPDSQVDGTHQRVTMLDHQGKIIAGRRLSEDTYDILIMDLQQNLHSIDKSNLVRLELQPASLMPSYRQLLSERDVEDITTYLFSIQTVPTK